jgi:hypothetical protein
MGITDGVARYMFVTAGRLTQAASSPRFTWMACKTDTFTSRPETMIEEAGTTLKAAADVLRRYGAVTESMLPFKISTTMYTGSENTFCDRRKSQGGLLFQSATQPRQLALLAGAEQADPGRPQRRCDVGR